MAESRTVPAGEPVTLYGNVFQITRTPWDITLFVYHGAPAPDTKPGTQVNLAEVSNLVAKLTFPVDVAKMLIKALETMTGDNVVGVVESKGAQDAARR